MIECISEWVKWALGLFRQRTVHHINGFTVQEVDVIGEGGYGFIYRVQDTISTSKRYALKKSICQTRESKTLFQNQVQMMVMFVVTQELAKGHDNVVTIYGSHKIQRADGLQGLILMELAEKTLLDFLKQTNQSRINEKDVLDLLLPVCKGLKHLHSKGITHRDLKTQNILLTRGVPKLCDFGSATLQKVDFNKVNKSQLYKYEEIFEKYSTLMYRPPEMIDLYLKYQVNQKVDIWMLGCVLFVMNFYFHPFQESGKLAIVNAQYRFPEQKRVTEKMKDFIRIMLTPNPSLRPSIQVVISLIQSWDQLPGIPLNRVVRGMKDNERHLKQGNYDQLTFEYNDAIAAEDQFSELQ